MWFRKQPLLQSDPQRKKAYLIAHQKDKNQLTSIKALSMFVEAGVSKIIRWSNRMEYGVDPLQPNIFLSQDIIRT